MAAVCNTLLINIYICWIDAGGFMWRLTEYETANYGQDNRALFYVNKSDYQ